VGVAVLLLRRGDEGSRVDRVEQLLLVERDAGDVDPFEPLLDLVLGAVALVDVELRVQNVPLLVLGREEKVCSLPSTLMANLPVMNLPKLVIRCWPSSTSSTSSSTLK
jgi:hypothetical protein